MDQGTPCSRSVCLRLARATQLDSPTKAGLCSHRALELFQSSAAPSQSDKLKCQSNLDHGYISPGLSFPAPSHPNWNLSSKQAKVERKGHLTRKKGGSKRKSECILLMKEGGAAEGTNQVRFRYWQGTSNEEANRCRLASGSEQSQQGWVTGS